MSFTGEFRHTIDAKGRLIVPARMRDELSGEKVWLTRWLDGCIAIWSDEGWEEIKALLRSQGSSNPKARDFVRAVTASASPDQIDKQGRIMVPQQLRDRAGITRDAVVVGVLNHGEIWDPERWEARDAEVDESRLAELAEGLDF